MLESKFANLKKYLKDLDSAIIAFSSGVDSTFLLKVAHEILQDKVIAVTVKSSLFPKRELEEATTFCKTENIKHIIVDIDELNIAGFKENPANRCYLCKKELFKNILELAKENNITNVLEGSNLDDEGDYRPGMQAIKELGIKSPLRIAKLTKEDIRTLSKELNLKTYNKPSFACLASRFVYGESITKEKLSMVDKAETYLFNKGFKQYRVRIHDKMARIEILPEEFEKLLKLRTELLSKFKEYGFTYITMDLNGYRTGSMNETLKRHNSQSN